jgi:hypothetical protein
MSEQIRDPFMWDDMPDSELVFISAENIYSLFDPEKYGLQPSMVHTACYKGFIVYFALKNNQLYIDQLEVYCKNRIYPLINGIRSKRQLHNTMRVYKNLNLALNYSGTVIIGTDFDEYYSDRAFTGAHCYHETYELYFSNGKLIDYRETSGEYSGF